MIESPAPISRGFSMPDESPNPLLLRWVKEWYDKAKEQNSRGQFTHVHHPTEECLLTWIHRYKKAYESLKACPLPLAHPSQAQELKGLGPKLCDRLTEKLNEHCAQNGLSMPEDPRDKGMRHLRVYRIAV